MSHQLMSAWAAEERRKWWCRWRVGVLVSIRRQRKILLAGMTLAANENFPIRDRRERFVHRVRLEKARSSCRSDDSLSGGSERD